MTRDVAIVNIEGQTSRQMAGRSSGKSSYHHGDLPSALLQAAVELIAERGLHGLSLRECARRAGVSHAAPYRHFADKNALLVALAQQGFEWLAEAGVAAMAGIADPRQRLDAYGVAYVRFAVEHPVHHRIMFAAELDVGEEGKREDNRAFGLLVEAAAAITGPKADHQTAALAAWSLPHGLAMLILDGRIPEVLDNPDAAEALARSIFEQWRTALR